MDISKRGGGISPSVTLEISAKAKAMKAGGASVVAFTAGEPDFNTPDHIIAAAKRALDEGKTKYTPTAGIAELRKAIAEKFLKDNGLSYGESDIVVSDGAKSSLYHALAAVVDEGDEVIIPAPYWVTYVEQVKLVGGVCKIVNTTEKSGYKLIKSDFERAITPKTKCLILNTPCNPTGAVYGEDELKDVAEVVERYGLTVISDEIYEKLIFDGKKHISIASVSDYMKDNTIVVNGVSKTYAMTGWRIGYLAAPTKVAKTIAALQGHTTSNACSFAQYAAVEALTGKESEKFVEKMTSEFDGRRKLLVSSLENIGAEFIYPQGAFYVFMKTEKYYGKSFNGKAIEGSVDFADALLDFGVAVIPGAAFGADGFIRLAYTVSEGDIVLGAQRIGKFIANLK